MTVIQEIYRTLSDGTVLVKTYSDAGVMIADANGGTYVQAIDVQGTTNTYTETEEETDDIEASKVRTYDVTLAVGVETTVCAVSSAYPIVNLYSDDVPLGNVRWAVDGNKLIAWTEGLKEDVSVTMSVIG